MQYAFGGGPNKRIYRLERLKNNETKTGVHWRKLISERSPITELYHELTLQCQSTERAGGTI